MFAVQNELGSAFFGFAKRTKAALQNEPAGMPAAATLGRPTSEYKTNSGGLFGALQNELAGGGPGDFGDFGYG
jgi:hypothetical protein